MSNAVSALNNASWSDGIAEITEVGPQGMITLRGDLASIEVKNAATGVAAVDFPDQLGANCVGERGICWMSPDELLILCPYEAASGTAEMMRNALGKAHSMVADVSDARALIRVEGNDVRHVLAKLTPANVQPEAFAPGDFRRSRLAQVAGAFWMVDDETFDVICFRSVARYVFDIVKDASRIGGEIKD